MKDMLLYREKSTNELAGWIGNIIRDSYDARMLKIVASRDINGERKYAQLWLGVKSDGSPVYYVSGKPEFRTTLGASSNGVWPVSIGGTGLTASPSMLTNLGSTTAADVFAASPRPGITGTLPISHGGTGKTTATDAWTALGGKALGKKDSASGTYSISRRVETYTNSESLTLANEARGILSCTISEAPSGYVFAGIEDIFLNTTGIAVMRWHFNSSTEISVHLANLSASNQTIAKNAISVRAVYLDLSGAITVS